MGVKGEMSRLEGGRKGLDGESEGRRKQNGG